ncbi:MAG: sugar phosphate nucleotidyltransferase [bacterium]|nr:sugar phosphate nucleotidyltransferase [bacterium]
MKIVIFSGGAGTRMWPLSRQALPKQFQKLIDDESLFQAMVKRILTGFDPEDVFVLTGKDYLETVAEQAPHLKPENILGEPEMRDNLAAVGFAASYLAKKFPGETMAAVWGADHLVKNTPTFVKALKLAEKLAKERNVIVKVDVRPSFPSVHLGYIEIGKKIENLEGFDIWQFSRHVEKPNYEAAEKFLKQGNFLWNTGYFVWELDKIMALFQKHTPEVYAALIKIQEAVGTSREEKVVEQEYQKIPREAIDYALFEKLSSEDQIEIEADLGWTDVGAWNVLKDELASLGGSANVVKGQHIDIDTKDCLIFGSKEGKLIATIGLEGMIVVDTPDALLICPKDRSQDVKKVVAEIKKRNKTEYL